MRRLLAALLFCSFLVSGSAQQADTAIIRTSSSIIGLHFTSAERDSMVSGVNENLDEFRKMHALTLPNNQSYPFGFNPVPQGFIFPAKQTLVKWEYPAGVKLPANRNELSFFSIMQLAQLIRTKQISSVELTRFFIQRIKKYKDTLECVITITEELAMQQAAAADAAINRGQYRGPLHGIPYGLKDLFAVKGYKTTWGAVPYKDQVIDEDAFVYSQLTKAGAVLCAKLSMGELANADLWFGGYTRNPWDLKTGSSGSSAGSASATAAGLLPFAIGTETYGSIISPSHRCGTTGLRPTFGSISRSGAMVLSWSLDKAGPICRSAEDAAIVFNYIKGTDGKDAGAVDRPFNYTGKADLKKLRIAYAANLFKPIEPGGLQWTVIEKFRALGANVKAVNFPDSAVWPFNIMDVVISAESAAAFDDLTRGDADNLIRRQDKNFWPNSFRVARLIPAVEYINANRHRYALMKVVNDFMKDYDVIITPSFSGNQLAITNLTGHPAVIFPIGFAANGRPNSITLLGNLYDEATILAVAKAFQDATDFNKIHPPRFQ